MTEEWLATCVRKSLIRELLMVLFTKTNRKENKAKQEQKISEQLIE